MLLDLHFLAPIVADSNVGPLPCHCPSILSSWFAFSSYDLSVSLVVSSSNFSLIDCCGFRVIIEGDYY